MATANLYRLRGLNNRFVHIFYLKTNFIDIKTKAKFKQLFENNSKCIPLCLENGNTNVRIYLTVLRKQNINEN